MESTVGTMISVLSHRLRFTIPSMKYELFCGLEPLTEMFTSPRIAYGDVVRFPADPAYAPGPRSRSDVNVRLFDGISIICSLVTSDDTIAVCDWRSGAAAVTSTVC